MDINIFHFSNFSSGNYNLPTDTIDVWFFDRRELTPDMTDLPTLTENEQHKILQYAQEESRMQHQASRCLLRLLLGKYLHISPKKIPVCTNAHGKLFLDQNALSPDGKSRLPKLYFNVSHTGTQLAFAFSCHTPVGIDIEEMRNHVRTASLANRFFHPNEWERFSHLSTTESKQLFFRYWTIREAFVKGLGTGFSIPSDSFLINESISSKGLYEIAEYPNWRIQALPAPDGYMCSLAYQI